MKRFHFAPLALALALGVSACDSGNDDSDADVFVGTHTVVKLEDNVSTTPRNLTAGVICATADAGPSQTNPCAVNSIAFQFRENGTYRLHVDYTTIANNAPPAAGGRADVTFDNAKTTYTINESAKTITLQVAATAAATPTAVTASYTISGDDQVVLSLPSVVFNTIFVTQQYQGTVRVTLDKN